MKVFSSQKEEQINHILKHVIFHSNAPTITELFKPQTAKSLNLKDH